MNAGAGRKYEALYSLIMEINENCYRVYDRGGYRIWLNVSESRQMAKRAAGLGSVSTVASKKPDSSAHHTRSWSPMRRGHRARGRGGPLHHGLGARPEHSIARHSSNGVTSNAI